MKEPLYTASIMGREYKIRPQSDQNVEIDGKLCSFDLAQIDESSFSLILSGRAYSVELLPWVDSDVIMRRNSNGSLTKTISLGLNGRQYLVQVDDHRSLLLKTFLGKAKGSSGTHVVKAPMPGLISRIEVKIGEKVTKGRGLLVLEAMKMENEIRAQDAGRVKLVHVTLGSPVEKGQPLVTIERL